MPCGHFLCARVDPRASSGAVKDTRTGTGAGGGGGTTMSLGEVEPQLQATKTVTLTTRTARHSTCTTAPPWSVAWCSALATLRHCPYCACRACDFCQANSPSPHQMGGGLSKPKHAQQEHAMDHRTGSPTALLSGVDTDGPALPPQCMLVGAVTLVRWFSDARA